MLSFHGVEDHLLPYAGGGNSQQQPFETWGADWAKRDGCAGKPKETQYKATVEEMHVLGVQAAGRALPRAPERAHLAGPSARLDHDTMVDYFSGKTTGKPFPLMVALGLTPEDFADTITLANKDIDASAMILKFFKQHTLASAANS